jgi:putative phosphoesterase
MIGIVSDSHDNLEAIREAVVFLNAQNVSMVLHAGDHIAPFTVREWKNLKCPFHGVFGNNDGERKGLVRAYSEMGTELKEFEEISFEGKKVALYHGTITEFLSALISGGEYDVVVRGHTHNPEIKKEAKTLVINPGELCGYLTGKKTLCLLDIASMEATIHVLGAKSEAPGEKEEETVQAVLFETKKNLNQDDTVSGEDKETGN